MYALTVYTCRSLYIMEDFVLFAGIRRVARAIQEYNKSFGMFENTSWLVKYYINIYVTYEYNTCFWIFFFVLILDVIKMYVGIN